MELIKVTPTDALSIGKTFFESGMFTDVKSAQQAVVKIMAGQEIGIPPFASMSGIHIIQGKPTIGAGLIASTIKGSGKYDYRVLETSEKNCTIEFFQGKESIGKSSFTIDDAKKAGTKNLDKFPKNMLFARAISNGVKWFCPDIFSGPVYTPEEMEVVTEDVKHEVVEPFTLTTEMQSELQTLLDNSTLTQARKDKAAAAIVAIKSQADFDKIKNTLLTVQKATV